MGIFSGKTDPHFDFVSRKDGDYIRSLLAEGFATAGVPVQDNGDHFVDSAGAEFGLHNAFLACRVAPRDDWPQILYSHAANTVSSMQNDEEYTRQVFERRGYVRLVAVGALPDEMRSELLEAGEQIGDSALTTLAVDSPASVVTIGPSKLVGIAREEAWRVGIANLRAVVPDVRQREEVDGVGIYVVAGDSFFIGSKILVLEDEVGELADPRFGVIVAAPTRHLLLFHPVVDMTVLQAIQTLASSAAGAFANEPGGISPHVYWWKDRQLSQLTHVRDDGALVVTPPPEFVELLNSLAADQE